jgi:hypothetical protein
MNDRSRTSLTWTNVPVPSETSAIERTSGTSSTSLIATQEAVMKMAVARCSIAQGSTSSLLRQESSLHCRQTAPESVGRNSVIMNELEKKTIKPRGLGFLFCRRSRKKNQETETLLTMDKVDHSKMASSFSRRAIEKINKQNGHGSLALFFKGLRPITMLNKSGSGVEVSDFSRMQRLVMEMTNCILFLDNSMVPHQEVEKWACVVYESMSASSRTFHGVQHVFDISIGADQVQKLAAFFHDCIYYTIDGGLSKAQGEILDGIIVEDGDDSINVTESMMEDNMEMVTDIFGFEKGQKLNPFKGLNEYLSAALAVRCFASFLSSQHLAEITCCIEATIPFREGNPMIDLYNRLRKANADYDLQMDEDEIVVAIKRAADFANRDLYNFTLANRAVFLSNTWNLLPESNISLRHTQVFRISDFAMALKKMTGFFNTLKAETIFCSFQNEPSNELITTLTDKAAQNICVALKYMNCKQLSIAVLGAFAALTGGDAPVAMFLGDLPDPHHISPSIEDMIRVKKKRKGVVLDERVFALLKEGRENESVFDIKKSPCAALLYAHIGDAGVEKALKYIVQPMDEENAKSLLTSLPKQIIAEIGLACCRIAVTRSKALEEIVRKIQIGGLN